jgi:hypothetical protein
MLNAGNVGLERRSRMKQQTADDQRQRNHKRNGQQHQHEREAGRDAAVELKCIVAAGWHALRTGGAVAVGQRLETRIERCRCIAARHIDRHLALLDRKARRPADARRRSPLTLCDRLVALVALVARCAHARAVGTLSVARAAVFCQTAEIFGWRTLELAVVLARLHVDRAALLRTLNPLVADRHLQHAADTLLIVLDWQLDIVVVDRTFARARRVDAAAHATRLIRTIASIAVVKIIRSTSTRRFTLT